MNFKTLLFDHISFGKCWRKPRSDIDSTWPVDINEMYGRAVGRSENPGVPVLFVGHNLPPMIEIGLTDLPKSGGARAPPATPGTTGLYGLFIKTKD